jgi:hypothetical protein
MKPVLSPATQLHRFTVSLRDGLINQGSKTLRTFLLREFDACGTDDALQKAKVAAALDMLAEILSPNGPPTLCGATAHSLICTIAEVGGVDVHAFKEIAGKTTDGSVIIISGKISTENTVSNPVGNSGSILFARRAKGSDQLKFIARYTNSSATELLRHAKFRQAGGNYKDEGGRVSPSYSAEHERFVTEATRLATAISLPSLSSAIFARMPSFPSAHRRSTALKTDPLKPAP